MPANFSVNRRLAVALVSAALLAAIAFPLKFASEMRDFEVYWQAAGRAVNAEPLYRPDDGHYQFKYFPAFAVLLVPFAGLPLASAKLVWLVFSVVLLVCLLHTSRTLLPSPRGPTWWPVVAALIVLDKFYGHELVLGQVNLLFATLVVAGGLRSLQAGGFARAGIWLGLAVLVKPYALLFLPYLLAVRAWRGAATLALAVGVGLAIPTLTYGVSGTIDLTAAWWSTVMATTPAMIASQDNVSIAGMYAKWFGDGSLASAAALVTIGMLAVIVPVTWTMGRLVPSPAFLEVGVLLTLIPLLSPQGWDYVLLLATPAVMLLADRLRDLPLSWALPATVAMAVTGLSLYDVMGRAAYAWFMSLSLVTICFLVIVVTLVRVRVGRLA